MSGKVSLPAAIATFAEALVLSGEYHSVDAYVVDLIERDQQQRASAAHSSADAAPDSRYATALDLVRSEGRASVSYLSRTLGLSYVRTQAFVERMEEEGIVSAADHVGRRAVLPTSSGGVSHAG